MGKWRYSSTILDLSTRWRLVVSFTPLPLYFRRKSPHYPIERRLGGPKSRSGSCEEEKYLTLARIRTLAVQPAARRYNDSMGVGPNLIFI
jgi:hypothetical protein